MSLITSCPACATMFRVVPDQLKISEGWVRCGHCAEVFDATAHLSDEAAVQQAHAPAPAEAPTTQPAPMMTEPAPMMTQPAPLDSLPPAEPEQPERFRPSIADDLPPPVRAAPAAPAGTDSRSFEDSSLDAPFVFRRSDLVDDPAPSVSPPAPLREPESRFPAEDEVQADDLDDVSFVREARRKALWRRPMVRIGLAFASLLLAAALLLQMAYDDRDRLAALQPQLRPWLDEMCLQLGCRLGPPRQIDAVVIENSGFNRLRNDAYRLSFTVRNNARIGVAAPSMELTLTDNQDQPVLRRVLSPIELGASDSVIAGGSDWSGTVGLVLNTGSGTRIAGYRLLAFYP